MIPCSNLMEFQMQLKMRGHCSGSTWLILGFRMQPFQLLNCVFLLDCRIRSDAKIELCKYFEFGGGCSRGSQCFFAHGKEELQQLKQQKMHPCYHSPASEGNTRKIFVGGLPITMDSGNISNFLLLCYPEYSIQVFFFL